MIQKYLSLVSFIFLLSSCATTPTGRQQLKLMPSAQLASMGNTSFKEMKEKKPLSQNALYNERTTCITHRLLKAIGEDVKKWEIQVFDDESPKDS